MRQKHYSPSNHFITICVAFLSLALLFFIEPHVAALGQNAEQPLPPFPVSVDPKNKTINPIEGLAYTPQRLLGAATQSVGDGAQFLAAAIMSTKAYDNFAPLADLRAVTIDPGMRREQVANALDHELGWTDAQRLLFLSAAHEKDVGEGKLHPATYILSADVTPIEALAAIEERFSGRVASRYASSTEDIVPMDDALTIASIIEREAGNEEEMRIIAGILWNRLFIGMRLQADSTLQYARGTTKNGWWPVPRPRDKYIDSPYNTYMHSGLPPTPIASPSVPAIMAALNPEKTDCMFFFHSKGTFYCSVTYEQHVLGLKKIYGRGR